MADESASDVIELLRSYDQMLDAAEREPRVAWVRSRPRPPKGSLDPWSLPRPTWLLTFFVRLHVSSATAALHRRLNRRAALGLSSAGELKDRDAVAAFHEGLPVVRTKTAIALLIVAAVIFGRFALDNASSLLSQVPTLKDLEEQRAWERFDFNGSADEPKVGPAVPLREESTRLIDRVAGAVGTDVTSVGKVFDALAGASLVDVALVCAGLLFSLYVVTRPFLSAFRLKRMLFNLDREMAALRHETTARWHVSRRCGVYDREAAVFDTLKARAPREAPLDLIVPALLVCSLPLALGVYLVIHANEHTPWFDYGLVHFNYMVSVGGMLIAITLARLWWLARAALSRRSGRQMRVPCVVELGPGERVAVRDPVVSAIAVVLFPYLFAFWWYAASRELRVLSQTTGTKKLGRAAILSALACLPPCRGLLLPPAISVARGWMRVARARRAAGLRAERRYSRAVGVVFGVLVATWLLLALPLADATFVLLQPFGRLLWYLEPHLRGTAEIFAYALVGSAARAHPPATPERGVAQDRRDRSRGS